MPVRPPRGIRFPVVLLAAAASLAIPRLMADGPALQPLGLPPADERSRLAADTLPPRFLEPLQVDESAPGTVAIPGAGRNWVGDAWIWDVPNGHGLDSSRFQADAEQDFAALDWWRRGFARMTVVLLTCGIIASVAVLLTLARRR